MSEPRFYLFECAPTIGKAGPLYVVDRVYNHKPVAQFSENLFSRGDARGRALREVERLNAWDRRTCPR